MISEKSIADLLAATNLPVLISEYVSLSLRAGIMQGCCPFHDEKTPSFKVFDDHYHCFGCGAHGNAIEFLQNHLGMSFPESARLLAGRAGIVIDEVAGAERKKNSTEELLVNVHRSASATYQRLLYQPENVAALEVLRKRGVDDDSITRFGIGFAPESWSTLSGDKAFKSRDLIGAGLACQRTNGKGAYDVFRGRIVFPVHNNAGNIVGFSGRLITGSGPKYLNTEETAIYHKGSVLFGINQARNAIRKQACVVVVEGVFDVITPAQNGFEHIVSTCGTALTMEQIALLFSVSKTIIFCFDGDSAGAKATWRAAEMMVEKLTEQHEVRLCLLPPEHDPDTLVRTEGVDRLTELVNNAPTLTQYIAQIITKGARIPEVRARSLVKAKTLWRRFASPTMASFFRQHICEELNLSIEEFNQLGGAPKASIDAALARCPFCTSLPIIEESLDLWRIRCACGVLTKPCNDADSAKHIWNRRNNVTPIKTKNADETTIAT